MSSFISAGIIFILTLGGIWLGTLLRRTLPKHHLNEHAKDVVRLGVGLIATMAALVLGLLIGAAKGSFDTQSTQLKQITADLILVDNILAQFGPEALPTRQRMRGVVGCRRRTGLFGNPKTLAAQRRPTLAPITCGAGQ